MSDPVRPVAPREDELQQLRRILEAFKAGTVAPPISNGPGKHQRAADRREVETIHKTLNVVLAEIDRLLAVSPVPWAGSGAGAGEMTKDLSRGGNQAAVGHLQSSAKTATR
jgi:hypothetical protein